MKQVISKSYNVRIATYSPMNICVHPVLQGSPFSPYYLAVGSYIHIYICGETH